MPNSATSQTEMDQPTQDRFDYALRLGDSALILGQRLGEWVGHAPALELEMAVGNLSLDLIGEAQYFLTYAGELEGAGRDADALAFFCDVLDFKNLLLVEQPNGDWAFTVARHFFVSVYRRHLFDRLQHSADPRIGEVASKIIHEVAYHLRFSRDWMLRLGDGTEESHARLQGAVDRLWRFTGEMLETDALEQRLAEDGVAVDSSALTEAWHRDVDAVLEEAKLAKPEVKQMILGGHTGQHTEHLGHILAEMQFMQRAYPGLEW